jgi:hypothetical protein
MSMISFSEGGFGEAKNTPAKISGKEKRVCSILTKSVILFIFFTLS